MALNFDLDVELEKLQRRNQELEERAKAHLAVAESALQMGNATYASPTKFAPPQASLLDSFEEPRPAVPSPTRAAHVSRPSTGNRVTSRPSTARSPTGAADPAASSSSPAAAVIAATTPRSRPGTAGAGAYAGGGRAAAVSAASTTPRTSGRVASAAPAPAPARGNLM